MLVQNIQLVLGLLYHLSVSQEGGGHFCKECRHFEHDLILTRDRNKEFHIYQHTTRHTELILTHSIVHENCTCPPVLPRRTVYLKNEDSLRTNRLQDNFLWSTNHPHHPHSSHLNPGSPLHMVQKRKPEHCAARDGKCKVQTVDTRYQLQPLRVTSYNIWNVNSLSDLQEDYESRISRLGKVGESNIDSRQCITVSNKICRIGAKFVWGFHVH